MKKVMEQFRPYYRRVAVEAMVLLACSLVRSLLGLCDPWPFKILVDSVLGNRPLPGRVVRWLPANWSDALHLLGIVIGAMVFLSIAELAVQRFGQLMNDRLGTKLVLRLREDLFEHLQRLDIGFHDNNSPGDLQYRVVQNTESIRTLFNTLANLLGVFVSLAVAVWIMIHLSWQLTLLAFTVCPVLVAITQFFAAKQKNSTRTINDLEARVYNTLHDTLSNMRLVQSFARELYEARRFASLSRQSRDAQLQMAQIGRRSSTALGVTTLIANMVTLSLASLYVLRGRLTVGELLVIQSYMAQLFGPLMQSATILGSLRVQIVGAERVCEILEQAPAIANPPSPITIEELQGDIEFRNVCFGYSPDCPLLRNVSFKVAAQEKVALVGMSGQGKTTILSLIPRLFESQGGSVLVDDCDVRSLDLEWLRQQIGFVWQDAPVLSGTLAENIRYGRLEASDDEVASAAASAGLAEMLERLPDGLRTEVGDRGVRVSTGERLRMALARAILKRPRILLLDEPTASLDAPTERRVLQTILQLPLTVIIVSHRPAPLEYVHRVIEISDSEIVPSNAEELTSTGAGRLSVV